MNHDPQVEPRRVHALRGVRVRSVAAGVGHSLATSDDGGRVPRPGRRPLRHPFRSLASSLPNRRAARGWGDADSWMERWAREERLEYRRRALAGATAIARPLFPQLVVVGLGAAYGWGDGSDATLGLCSCGGIRRSNTL